MNRLGGLIVAASNHEVNGSVSPLLEIGSISLIKRMVLTFQKAGVTDVVIVTGYESFAIEQELWDYGVIFLKNHEYLSSDKLASVKLGLRYLEDKCDRVFFASVASPLFKAVTLQRLAEANGAAVVPMKDGRKGHPILFDRKGMAFLNAFTGDGGVRAALESMPDVVTVPMEDTGILRPSVPLERMAVPSEEAVNEALIHPFLRITLEKEKAFFTSRAMLLLVLIDETHSVKSACDHMALSKGKAWAMINELEAGLGYAVVERRHGGKHGGNTELLPAGKEFLAKYRRFEQAVRRYATESFFTIFSEFNEE